MKKNTFIAGLLAATVLGGGIITPMTASAQRGRDRDDASAHRQRTKNEWRNIAIGSGALGVLGLLNHDSTLTFGGAAGALYSANRYEQDRKSQSRIDRARAGYFDHDYFYRDGQRYNRRTVNRNGQRYYQFERERHHERDRHH